MGLSGERVEGDTVLPTRLIDVLLEEPRLCITKCMRGRYTALSHRWGSKKPLLTTNISLGQHKRGIAVAKLPRTFRDAINLTRQLRIQYIWIDSLCIIQDSKEDWAAESQLMGTIYERSYLTVAATNNIDGDTGLFHSSIVGSAPQYVEFPCDAARSETGSMYFSSPVPRTKFPSLALEESPLNERGWVFQERVLSRCIVHFIDSQVYWECQGGMACQSGLIDDWQGIKSWHGNLQRPLDYLNHEHQSLTTLVCHPDDIDPTHPIHCFKHANTRDPGPNAQHYSSAVQRHLKFHVAWEHAMCYYSTRKLTFSDDRVVALQGVVERLEKRMKAACLAGHWCDSPPCFIKSLSWAVHRPGVAAATTEDTPAARSPSWSWLAREQQVYYPRQSAYLRAPWMHAEWHDLGRKDCGMHLVTPLEELGVSVWGSAPKLTFTGLLSAAVRGEQLPDDIPWRDKGPGDYIFHLRIGHPLNGEDGGRPDPADRRSFALLTESSFTLGWVRFDSLSQPDSFYCCPMYATAGAIPCLVLQRRASEKHSPTYQRVGLAMVCGWERTTARGREELDRDGVASWLESSRRQTFELV